MPDTTIEFGSEALMALADACAAVAAALRAAADCTDSTESGAVAASTSAVAPPARKPSYKPPGQTKSLAAVLGRFKRMAPKTAKRETNAAADALAIAANKPLAPPKAPTPTDPSKAAALPKQPRTPPTPKIPATPAVTKPAALVGVPAYAFGPKDEAFKPGKKVGTD